MNQNTFISGVIRHMHYYLCTVRKKLITAFEEIQKKSFGIKSSQNLLPVMGNKESCFR